MLTENAYILFPQDTCKYNDVLGYADFSSNSSDIASNDFTYDYSKKGTKCCVALTGDIANDTTGTITVKILDKDKTETVGKTILDADDLKNGKEVRVPFFTDKGGVNFTLKVTSTISKGGLYATLKHEVG